jgi:magnesium and cobalt exporter, CNNM family
MTVVLLIGVLVLVLVNAFFVAAEFSLVRARRSRLEQLGESDASARLALREIDEISEYLSACQLGITLASIGIGFLGEPAVAALIHPWLGGALSHGVALALSLTVAYVITTALHITIGEQVPKIVAIARAEAMARRIARPLHLFTTALRPFVLALNGASNAILRLLRVDPSVEFEEGSTPEDLRLLIAQSLEGGQLDPGEAGMLSGVFELHERQARQAMTPIPEVIAVDLSDDAATASRRCVESGHTRLVVTEDSNHNRVRGLVHANSLLELIISEGPEASIAGIVRAALIVPETKPLDELLAALRAAHSSLAVVVDEYGLTAGVISVEDVVEEIVGEIADETDPSAEMIRTDEGGDLVVGGHVAIAELQGRGIDLEVDSDAYNSIGGLVFAALGRLPKEGDAIAVDGLTLTVEAVRENRIALVRISERPGPQGNGAARAPRSPLG